MSWENGINKRRGLDLALKFVSERPHGFEYLFPGTALRMSYRVTIESRDLEPFHSTEQCREYRILNNEYRLY